MTANYSLLYGEHQEVKDEHDVATEWTKKPELKESLWDNKLYNVENITAEDYKNATSYSFSFWHRFSF